MRKLIAFLLRRKTKQEPLPEDAARVVAALQAFKAIKQPGSRAPSNDR